MKIFPLVKRAVTVIVTGSATNFLPRLPLRLRATAVMSGIFARVAGGFSALQAPSVFTSMARCGFRLLTRIAGTMAAVARGGFRVTNSSTGMARPQARPASRITQVTYTLAGLYGAAAVVDEATVGDGWQNDANATGKHDGAVATLSGNVLNAQAGRLVLDFAEFPDKSSLVIGSVQLEFYVRSQGTALNNGDLRLQWRKSPADSWTTLEIITDDVDALTTPRVFDLSGSIAGWSDMDTIQAGVFAATDVAENLIQYQCDAVELRINASRTETF